ncbi:MAG: SPOR domain-containing protein [Alphaproteobacteria bacterium]|nr:SPOR domain-containing protein [Alphaproteobacteria bacterium]
MNDDNTMDLLDLDDGASMDALPDAAPFVAPRPKKPWLLLGIGLLIIILAVYIIIRTIGGNDTSSMDVDLDAPTIVVDGGNDVPAMDVNPNPVRPDVMPVAPGAVPPPAPQMIGSGMPVPTPVPSAQPAPVAQPAPKPAAQPVAAPASDMGGVPTRVVEDRKTVSFNPDKPAAKPKPAAKKPTPAPKPSPKKVAAQNGGWYVQFGSYSTRALAEAAQRQIRSAHSTLFQGKQFVILAAQMPNGQTLYRLRIAFATSSDANGFCRNAKSDGLDCYVAK